MLIRSNKLISSHYPRPHSISNLSNIFGVTVENPEAKDAPSLRYVSPKQAKSIIASPTDASADGANDWKVQVAKVVTAYKLLNQENISQGKIGIAILKNNNSDRFRLILYRSKNNVLSTLTITDDTTIYRNNLYLQFRDDLQIFWSVLFSGKDLDEVLAFIGSKVKTEKDQDIETEHKMEKEHTETVNLHSDPVTTDGPPSDDKLKETKANLLKRMAKMGQPLPKFQASHVTTTDVSDSSDTEAKVKVLQKPIVANRKPKAQPLVPVVSSNMQMIPASGYVNYVGTNPANSTSLAVTESQYINIVMAENRTQNSELRMNISKLETKIEKVLDKIDVLNCKRGDAKRENKEDEIIALEEKVLDLKKENRGLKQQIEELLEKSTASRRNSELEDDTSQVSSLLARYNVDLDTASQPIDIYKQLVHLLDSEITRLTSSFENASKSSELLTLELDELTSKLHEAEQLIVDLKARHEAEIEALNGRLKSADSKCKELSNSLVEQSAESEQDIKDIMNSLYQKLTEQFQTKETFTAAEVTRICAHAIKIATNNVIKKKQSQGNGT